MQRTLIAGSRESPLALTQTHHVIDALKQLYPDCPIDLRTYKTQGDLVLETALAQIGEKGLFVKELEAALLAGEIDFAVHSMKDMPSEQPSGLTVFAFGRREIPRDVLVSKTGVGFWQLPTGAVVGTSSLRRQALLKHMRPELAVQNIRGNVQTRLDKMQEGPYDAVILASAGLHRLHLEHRIAYTFTPEEMMPAPCQGTLAVEIRAQDEALMALFAPLTDTDTEICTHAERAFLKTLQGGCQIPMAAYAFSTAPGQYQIQGLVSNPEGTRVISAEREFTPADAQAAGQAVAEDILSRGGQVILEMLLHNHLPGFQPHIQAFES